MHTATDSPLSIHHLRWQPFGRQRKYRHMARFDRKCWESFIDNHPGHFHNVCYDVPVGRGVTVQDIPDIKYQKMASALTQHRIDVLGTSSNAIHICEIKPSFTPAAVGQLLTYRSMFQRTYQPDFPIILEIIYFTGSEDSFLCARDAGVTTLLAASSIPSLGYPHTPPD